VVLLNTDAQPHTISLTTPGFVASSSSAFRTVGNVEQTAALGALSMQNAVTLPSHSLVTAVLEGAAGE
jgi:hypothetical protein